MEDIEKLKLAISKLESRNEHGNKDYDNCLRWLKELLEIKLVEPKQ